MPNVSIYEKKWLDLVFEGKNKKYGAYQLRQDSSRTTLAAFFFGILFIGTLSGLTMVLSSFGAKPAALPIEKDWDVLKIVKIANHVTPKSAKVMLPKKAAAAPVTNQKQLSSHTTVVSSTEKPDDVTTKSQSMSSQPNEGQGSGTATSTENPLTGENGTAVVEVPVNTNTPVITAVLDKLPEFPGGIEKFYKYVGNNFEKPEIDEQKTIKILVAFVIEKDGSMTDIKVLRNPGYGLDKEAIRVLKALKIKWSPGIMNGKAVRTAYNLPISVQMQ
ncbi:hypothetical protein FNO01nite_11540 [Flavobacterium noncentrifugens]|uniref:Protein TonB n=1 Tax=Flavobacterium noncentrifugens TaxID=1128970 RepID=A0A1G8VFX6_9FLAO|nr:energy transducer TonB [Flavobacterium noncentrifugens]GEP50482.1 hypothetical protein FNO01nite_11540 [Flavobacterium noncentrifugens]SDJ64787.1 protein TonB [Flavobacterium noncentrifugens]